MTETEVQKEQRLRGFRVTLGDLDFELIAIPSSIISGMAMSIDIITSSQFREAFIDLVGTSNFNADRFETALDRNYTIRFLRKTGVIDAFSCVYRKDRPSDIFFNPILLLNFRRSEMIHTRMDANGGNPTLPGVLRKQAIYVAIKIVHEMTHLLHYRTSLSISGVPNTPDKAITDITADKGALEVGYHDLGTMMEKRLFGGCIELKSNPKSHFMDLDEIAVYPSINTRRGQYLDADKSVISPEEVKIVLGQHFQSKCLPSPNKVINVGVRKSSAPLKKELVDGSDVFDYEEESEDDNGDDVVRESLVIRGYRA